MKEWVAKCSENLGKLFTDYELSPRFENAQECQEYIDKNLKIVEYLLKEAFHQIILKNNWKDGKQQYQLSLGGSMIRCYNIKQKRFADGFDF